MDSLPGDPNARPGDVDYVLPLSQPEFRIDQGYGGQFSHTDTQNRYAVDFAADDGTPVLAARDGVVMQVESDFDKAGLNREKLRRARQLRPHPPRRRHAWPCTRTCRTEACCVRVGQRVRARPADRPVRQHRLHHAARTCTSPCR